MIRHTIVTSTRDLKNDLSLEELKSLAHAMDHSVKTAERVYQHNKQELINDNTKIIEFVLELKAETTGTRRFKKEWRRRLRKVCCWGTLN